jgi:hypothetical protein
VKRSGGKQTLIDWFTAAAKGHPPDGRWHVQTYAEAANIQFSEFLSVTLGRRLEWLVKCQSNKRLPLAEGKLWCDEPYREQAISAVKRIAQSLLMMGNTPARPRSEESSLLVPPSLKNAQDRFNIYEELLQPKRRLDIPCEGLCKTMVKQAMLQDPWVLPALEEVGQTGQTVYEAFMAEL